MTMLKLSFTKSQGGQLFLLAQGAMTLESIGQLRNALAAVVGKYAEVLLDIGKVTEMDSAAAEMLVLARTAGLACGTTVRLIGLSNTSLDLLLFVKLITTYGPPTQDLAPVEPRRLSSEEIRITATGRVVDEKGSGQIEFGDFCDNYAAFSVARHRIEKGAIDQGVAELRLLREHIVQQPNELKSVRHLLPAINEAIDAAASGSGRTQLA
jgi:anti-anti-sigma regulatory factor